MAVIGVGNTGSANSQSALQALGAEVMLCDPPRAEKEGKAGFVSFRNGIDKPTLFVCMCRSLKRGLKSITKHLLTAERLKLIKLSLKTRFWLIVAAAM